MDFNEWLNGVEGDAFLSQLEAIINENDPKISSPHGPTIGRGRHEGKGEGKGRAMLIGNPDNSATDDAGAYFVRAYGRDVREDSDAPSYFAYKFPDTDYEHESLFAFPSQDDADAFLAMVIRQNMGDMFVRRDDDRLPGQFSHTYHRGMKKILYPSDFGCYKKYVWTMLNALARRVVFDTLMSSLHNFHPVVITEVIEGNGLGARFLPHMMDLISRGVVQAPAKWEVPIEHCEMVWKEEMGAYLDRDVKDGRYPDRIEAYKAFSEASRKFVAELRCLDVTKEEWYAECNCRDCRLSRARNSVRRGSVSARRHGGK